MSDEQREMTLHEWCNKLPSIHRVNREKSKVIEAVGLLNSMVCCGEPHSDESRRIVSEVIDICKPAA